MGDTSDAQAPEASVVDTGTPITDTGVTTAPVDASAPDAGADAPDADAGAPDADASVPAPTISSFTAASAKISRYTTTSLTAVFAGGTASIDQGVGTATSGTAVTTGPVPGLTTFTLTVTNSAGVATTATVAVDTKREVFVGNTSSDGIVVFDEDADGNVAPKRQIAGGNTSISNVFGIAAVDDEIIVSTAGNNILTFDMSANGDVAPKRQIAGAATTISGAGGVFVTDTMIFATPVSSQSILVFNRTDTGNIAPTRTVTGALTTLSFPGHLWLDGTDLYVTNGGNNRPLVFDVNATGNEAPMRTLSNVPAYGLSIDGNNLIAPAGASVAIVDKTTGAPVRKITGANTTLQLSYQCVVAGTDMFCNDNGEVGAVAVFPSDGDGNIAPTRRIAGTLTHLGAPAGIAVK